MLIDDRWRSLSADGEGNKKEASSSALSSIQKTLNLGEYPSASVISIDYLIGLVNSDALINLNKKGILK